MGCNTICIRLRKYVYNRFASNIEANSLTFMSYFLVVFSFFEKTTYCCRTRRLSVCLLVRLSSVDIISFQSNWIFNRPIAFKFILIVAYGVVHLRKAWFFEIPIASCKFMQLTILLIVFNKNTFVCTVLTDLLTHFSWTLIYMYVLRSLILFLNCCPNVFIIFLSELVWVLIPSLWLVWHPLYLFTHRQTMVEISTILIIIF